VNACKDLQVELSLHAAGALAPDEAARVLAHLDGCAACRAEAAASAEVLALAALPPPAVEERRALDDLPRSTLDAIRRAERRRGFAKRLAAGIAVAAAAAAVVLAPAALRREPVLPEEAAVVVAWDGPDLDLLWEDAGVVDLEASASLGGDLADAGWVAVDD
jgi:anti-sigma factor RsiW